MVVSNGARIVCGNQQIDYGISQTSAKRLLSVLNGYPNLRITLETGDCAYSNYPISDYETVISNDLERIAESKGVLKILVHIDDNDTLDIVRKAITEDLYYTVAHGYLIQIMSKYATKWNGIKAMLDISNCSPEETAYFGDDYDDIEPIEMCGVGVAVSNGIDAIKSKADYIAKSNDEDGVAIFIEEMLFKK
jgi:hydroxymethylpyrimidine pyrophosphatase-like HAD family hydrolase